MEEVVGGLVVRIGRVVTACGSLVGGMYCVVAGRGGAIVGCVGGGYVGRGRGGGVRRVASPFALILHRIPVGTHRVGSDRWLVGEHGQKSG